MKKIEILGCSVHQVDFAVTLKELENFIAEKTPHLVITLGTEMVMEACRNREFQQIISKASLVVPDTVGILWAAKKQGIQLPEKVAGIDLIWRFSELAQEKSYTLYLLGSKEEVVLRAAGKLQEKYPSLLIKGTHTGYFTTDEEEAVIQDIQSKKPDVLLVGLGSPKQELWISRNLTKLGVPVVIGIGGSFDVIAGNLKRAPNWMIKLGLEWLFRLFQEPKRFKRMLVLPKFALLVLKGSRRCSIL